MSSSAESVGSVSAAREVAARVLVRVRAEGAFASAALDAELARRAIDPRDAGLATELVYGVLRTEGALRQRLDALASRGRATLEPALADAHLLMGAYALAFLDRVPAFAAVSEAVAGVRAASDPRAAGFANAVLRAFAQALEADGRPALEDAVAASAPGWLRGALRRSLGRAGASAFLAAGPVPPPLGLCVANASSRDGLLDALARSHPSATFERGAASPHAILARGAGDPRKLDGLGGAFLVQEEGAQVLALALSAKPGERVLDACAGHGNKSFLLGHAVGPEGAVDAADLYPSKLDDLAASPVGKHVRARYAVDWSASSGEVPAGYDAVLVDAPCSGTGTLRRRPEIALHRAAEDVPRLAALQRAITLRAATRVREGGRLVYAVCSVLREESEEVVAALLGASEGERFGVRLEPAPFLEESVARLASGGSTLRLLPHVHGTDGYFAASFVVRR